MCIFSIILILLQDKVIHVNSLEGDVYISPLVNICCVADTPPKSTIGDMLPMPGYCISILLQMDFYLLILITLPILSLTSIQYGK